MCVCARDKRRACVRGRDRGCGRARVSGEAVPLHPHVRCSEHFRPPHAPGLHPGPSLAGARLAAGPTRCSLALVRAERHPRESHWMGRPPRDPAPSRPRSRVPVSCRGGADPASCPLAPKGQSPWETDPDPSPALGGLRSLFVLPAVPLGTPSLKVAGGPKPGRAPALQAVPPKPYLK